MSFVPEDAIKFVKEKGLVSRYGWHAEFNKKETRSSPPKPPRLKTLAEFTPMALRYLCRIYIPNKKSKTMPFIDPLNPVRMEPMYGVPLGGIGCGTIGRGFKGEFCRSSLRPGIYNHKVNAADQFIVTVFRGGEVYQKVLSPYNTGSDIPHGLLPWEWGFPADRGHYIGLYPRSWTIYELPELALILVCEQISPVIPHNYKDSCLPVGVFQWTVLNFHPTQEARVSITLTWRGPRYKNHSPPSVPGSASAQCCDPEAVHTSIDIFKDELTQTFEAGPLRGCLMETRIGYHIPCCFGVAAAASNKVKVTRCPGFQYKTLHKVPPRGRMRRSESKNESRVFPSSSASLSSHSSETPTQGNSKAHTCAPPALVFWKGLKTTGVLNDDTTCYKREGNKRRSSKLVMAVCATCIVPPAYSTSSNTASRPTAVLEAGTSTLHFFVTWHIPRIHFRSATVAYRRRYTRWFSEDIIRGTKELLTYAAENWRRWKKAIIEWQAPILSDPNLPDWYKSALFNELYFISDGGTVWLDPLPNASVTCDEPPIDAVRKRNPHVTIDPLSLTGRDAAQSAAGTANNTHTSPFQARAAHGRKMGLFAYLEGHEYRMFNTYDVHFNASWALIELWPKIELAVLYDLVDMTASEDSTPVTFIYKGVKGPCNACLGVPHDCGDPEREPWFSVNAYIMYPTDTWKDLSPKLILMAWRDWKITGNRDFLHYVLPVIIAVVQSCLEKWDTDGDGIIENAGFPDQTYDTWKSRGLSAYVGGLWVAALYAAHDMLTHAGNKVRLGAAGRWSEVRDNLSGLLKRAKSAYHNQLWGGEFYRYDNTTPLDAHNSSVMADQLSGHWFLRMGGAPADAILSVDAVMETLKTIVRLNWLSVRDGRLGAINSILSNSKIDTTNVQAEEFWVAVNYGLGALLILHGMASEGFRLAGSCFEHVYNQLGLHFQTPEAFTKDATYRSLGYMRPLAIWSIQRAIELTHQ